MDLQGQFNQGAITISLYQYIQNITLFSLFFQSQPGGEAC